MTISLNENSMRSSLGLCVPVVRVFKFFTIECIKMASKACSEGR